MFSIEASGYKKRAGETKPRVNSITKGELPKLNDFNNNMMELFMNGFDKIDEESRAFGLRRNTSEEYKWMTRREFYFDFKEFSYGLKSIGMEPKKNLGVYMKNSYEWMVTEYSSYYGDYILVSMHEMLDRNSVMHIIEEAELEYIICSADRANFLLDNYEQIVNKVKWIILVNRHEDKENEELLSKVVMTKEINVMFFESVIKMGKKMLEENEGEVVDIETQAKPDDVATICYTSGTTGMPKGVMITHRNLLCAIGGINCYMEVGYVREITEEDSYLAILPMSHIFGRVVVNMMISFGSCVGFPSKAHSSSISNDIKTFKPTIFVGVPRIFEKLRKSVFTEVEKRGGLISLLFKYGLYVKGKKIKKNGDKRWLFDKFVFKTVADQLGGRVSMIISGSAPATGEMLMFMRCCFDGDLHEGYGCTETTGMCTVTIAGDNSGSNIGPPMINTMIKLVDVPEIGYYTTDRPNPRGEICVKGHCVFKGYYKRPHGTQRVMDKDGWYHTGDIGMFDKTGSVVIIDRKTHFFKLPQGEYVSPEKIESILTSDHLIQQAFVYGDSNRPCLVAILHPDRDRLIEYASRRLKNFNPRELTNSIMKGRNDGDAKSGRSEKTEESNSYHASDSNSSTSMSTTPTQNNASAYNELYKILCRRPVLIKLLLKDLKAQLKSCGLVELEVIRNIYLDPVPFQDSDLLSISMKLVRDKAKAHYSKVIDKLYQDINV